ncbi:hypothetical protein [Halocalculus aciditolerans]|uniref:Uncharacterized protein n=1 Tax=Halocalculus aciditolerans TaxID=1383812 RepID=A0A830FA65_9EURY|nr:hypothetical protein [Halocalculus aciditolerans]GGL55128.1 hypothetical protein GCM10009039_11540 [Halocalculus aciditolerans]
MTYAVVTLKDREDGGPMRYRTADGVDVSETDPDAFVDHDGLDDWLEGKPLLVKARGLDDIRDICGPGIIPAEHGGEPAEEPTDEPTDATPAEALPDDLVDVLDDGTIGDLEDALATGEYDGVLDLAQDYEVAHQDREGAVDAIHGRARDLAEEAN